MAAIGRARSSLPSEPLRLRVPGNYSVRYIKHYVTVARSCLTYHLPKGSRSALDSFTQSSVPFGTTSVDVMYHRLRCGLTGDRDLTK